MGKTTIWFCCLGSLLVGLNGCQGNLQDPNPLVFASVPSSGRQASSVRSLAPPYTLAILPLENVSPYPNLQWVGKSFSEMLASDLAKWPFLKVIAREALGSVLREQWLQQRGFSPSTAPVELGHIQGVHYLVRGSIAQFQQSLIVDLQIIDVETDVIVGSLRAQGANTEVPQIEYDLVMQMLPFFESDTSGTSGRIEDRPGAVQHDSSVEAQNLERDYASEGPPLFSEHSIHQIDMQLSLERLTHQRILAYQTAKDFWQKSWSAEIGQPFYHLERFIQATDKPMSLLSLPFAVFMQKNLMKNILKNQERENLSPSIQLVSDGLVLRQSNVRGAPQLFFERIGQPHRLFVRAVNEHGEVMAVYSKWSWQSEELVHVASPERIVFPISPQPFLRGLAEFPLSWVERGGQHVTFDLVMVSNFGEQRTISLEPIHISDSEESDSTIPRAEDLRDLLPLKNFIRTHWNPPIAETLPVAGYLPANKQKAVALLSLSAGKIEKVEFLHHPDAPLFSRSLMELKSRLLGYCLSCQRSDPVSSHVVPHLLRLQLTLVKDLSELKLGSFIR